MTEAEWLACEEPRRMLRFLADKASGRKLRLFAIACSRGFVIPANAVASEAVFRVGERIADGEDSYVARGSASPLAELRTGHREADLLTIQFFDDDAGAAAEWASWMAVGIRESDARDASLSPEARGLEALIQFQPSFSSPECVAAARAESMVQAGLLRDLAGDLFRPGTLDPAHRTPTAWRIAQAAYEERELPSGHLDIARLGVLSDALEEAGCTDEALLSHLRSPGPHVRGCWALDLVLGQK